MFRYRHVLQKQQEDRALAVDEGRRPETISDEKWNSALRRRQVIERWLALDTPSVEDTQTCADELGCHLATFYRMVAKFRSKPRTSSLVTGLDRGNKTKKRLEPKIEEIITTAIDAVYLTKQRLIPARVVEEVRKRCFKAGLKAPAKATIYQRISSIPAYTKAEKRVSATEAKQHFQPIGDGMPEATRPLEIVQIDHTPGDVTMVDMVEREPIDRPWITTLTDNYSRACLGLYISFGAPSILSTALCLTQAVLPKEHLLREHKISGDWPMFGLPEKILVDNGSDFQSGAFRRGCDEHGISLEYRPKGAPKFGAIIERFFKTLNHRTHDIPGTTFSNVAHRGEYDSSGKACMTLRELEGYLFEYVVNVYNQSFHQGIGMPPAAKFELGLGKDPKTGMHRNVRMPDDQKAFLIDFLPVFKRTVQRYGVRLDGISYYSDILGQILFDGDSSEYEIRRDPRDISRVYLYHPHDSQYYELPYRNISHPPMSIWELKHIQSRLRKRGEAMVDEERIFAGLDAMQTRIATSVAQTKRAKKQRRTQKRRLNPHQPTPVKKQAADKPAAPEKSASTEDLDLDFDPSIIEEEIKIR